jgi:SAM-dependent methyltransferase
VKTRSSIPDLDSGRAVIACPACGASDAVVIGEEAPAFETTIGHRTIRHPAFAVSCCAACGMYFKSHTLPVDGLGDYYRRLGAAPFDVEGSFPTDRALHRFLNRLPAGSRILDFGCSTGRVLRDLTTRFECYGVEINAQAASVARARGILVITEAQVRSGKLGDFDAIILTDVVEHLLQPLELLAALVRTLKRGGGFAIVTGNADAIRTRDRIAEFWYFQLPGHLQMMSERHVSWLATTLDMRVEELHRCSHYDSPFIQRAKQFVQSFAYHQFRRAPRGLISNALRFTPVLCRAENWSRAPALTYTADHFVVVMRKP